MLTRSNTGPIVKRSISSIGGSIAGKSNLADVKFVTKWNLKSFIRWMNMNVLTPRRVKNVCSKSQMYRMFILRLTTIIVNYFNSKNNLDNLDNQAAPTETNERTLL